MPHSSQYFSNDSEKQKEQKLKETVYFVEATGYEQLCIWQENHKENDWVQDMCGFSQVIGYLDKKKTKPVNVSFTFAVVNGQRICFYDVVSRYADHQMVEKFLEKNYPVMYDRGQRRAMDDAMNFDLRAVQDANDRIQYKRMRKLLEDIGVTFDEHGEIMDGHHRAEEFLKKQNKTGVTEF